MEAEVEHELLHVVALVLPEASLHPMYRMTGLLCIYTSPYPILLSIMLIVFRKADTSFGVKKSIVYSPPHLKQKCVPHRQVI